MTVFSTCFGTRTVIFEGAMGTMLLGSGADLPDCIETLNVDSPELVRNVHRLYHDAGAQWGIANTFGATANRLAGHHAQDRAGELNRAGVEVADEIYHGRVLGDVGPCGLGTGFYGTNTFDRVVSEYASQIDVLIDAGAHALLVETMIDITDARAAAIAARETLARRGISMPVLVTCSFDESGRMPLSGTTPEAAAVALEAVGADGVGMNCGLDSAHLFPLMERMAGSTKLPLAVQPNAGHPTTDANGAISYQETPEEAAAWARKFHEIGVQVIGSCCGTTPAFTAALSGALSDEPVPARACPAFPALSSARERFEVKGDVLPPVDDFDLSGYADDEADRLESDLLMQAALASEPLCVSGIASPLLERALRVYPGRALVMMAPNSRSDERAQVTKIAARYGALLRD